MYLRQKIESRLASLLYEHKEYKDALKLIETLLREVRALDDKLMLVDIQMTESAIHLALRNVPKAKVRVPAFCYSSLL